MVVQLGHDRETYAESILKVCEFCTASPLASAAGVGGGDLSRRIKQIMRAKAMLKLRSTKKILLTAVAAGTIGSPFLAGLLTQNAALAQQAEQPRPLVRIAPRYPAEAAEGRLAGQVVVEYTITQQGIVENVVVVQSTSSIFDEAAVASAQRYIYQAPAAPVPGVRMTIRFELERGACGPVDPSGPVCIDAVTSAEAARD